MSAAIALALMLIVLGFFAPAFFSLSNLRDLILNSAPLLVLATGMSLVILVGEIDISVGSQFAVISICAGSLAKAGAPIALLLPSVLLIGGLLGAINGLFIGRLGLPSIVVTLAMMVGWREGLRWATQGAWVQDLPPGFQWFGMGQRAGETAIVSVSLLLLLSVGLILRNISAGRAIYAVGSDREAARLTGIEPQKVVFSAFALMGMLTGVASLLNAVRFSSVPGNSGSGIELKAIAAVVVGGTAITGGRGNVIGTLIGVSVLGILGPALTFLGINPFWEKALQGAIILVALFADRVLSQLTSLLASGMKLRSEGAK